MTDSKYALFYNNICSANFTSSIYNGWSDNYLNNLSSSERTIYYDGNIAFTSGDKSVVSTTPGDGSLLAVPDLYGTLKGLNDRINYVSANIGNARGEVSTADAYLYVSTTTNVDNGGVEHIISTGNGNPSTEAKHVASGTTNRPISLEGPSASKFTVNGDDFLFTVGDKKLSLTNILEMIEELRARTAPIKTSIARCFVTGEPYFSYDKIAFGVNTIEHESN